jgi:hypothetical protein
MGDDIRKMIISYLIKLKVKYGFQVLWTIIGLSFTGLVSGLVYLCTS